MPSSTHSKRRLHNGTLGTNQSLLPHKIMWWLAAFLHRARAEKSSSQLCDKIRSLKQEDMDVKAYASKRLCMRQRVEDTLKPSIKHLAKWFISWLETLNHAALNTRNVEIEEDFEVVIVEAKIAERKRIKPK